MTEAEEPALAGDGVPGELTGSETQRRRVGAGCRVGLESGVAQVKGDVIGRGILVNPSRVLLAERYCFCVLSPQQEERLGSWREGERLFMEPPHAVQLSRRRVAVAESKASADLDSWKCVFSISEFSLCESFSVLECNVKRESVSKKLDKLWRGF